MALAPIEIRQASVDAVADGIRSYLPKAVGILVIGIPICLLAAFAHFILGISTPATAAGTFATAVGQLIPSFHRN